jgi:ABC-type molybdate transport system permease subunit
MLQTIAARVSPYFRPRLIDALHNYDRTRLRTDITAGITVGIVALPLAKPGFLTAIILAFAHTVGEFGVVLMIGGNIPGVTRVASVQIYHHVEALE